MNAERALLSGSISSLSTLLAERKLTAVEMAAWYLERIAAHNAAGASLNAVRTVAARALEDAAIADAELAAGQARSPLHGIPFLIKDNILTADGMHASAGALALETFKPKREATLVRRLRAAGAVLLGKTNMTEFADFVSDVMPAEFSGAGGVVRNPHGTRYDRGQGSSVGSAAAVAARFAPFAIGTETQNSIQAPAAHSSVVGFKPSVGTVSRYGIVPLVPSQDSPGPITVTVEDAALVFSSIAGPDSRDAATLSQSKFKHPAFAAGDLKGVRIGIPRVFMAEKALTAANANAFDDILRSLSRAGATIVDPCDLPCARELDEVRSIVFRTEFKASLNAFLKDFDAPCGMASLEMLIKWNTANPHAIPYGQSLLIAANQTAGLLSDQYLQDRQRDVELSLGGGIAGAIQAGEVDVLLCPMTVAAKCTGKAGAPVIAIPGGADAEGRPFGITLFAAPGQDQRLLEIAAGVERIAGKRLTPGLG